MAGWIKIYRQVKDNWIWKDSKVKTKFEAWMDLLLEANPKPKKVLIQNTIIQCDRGQQVRSLDTLGKDWKWDKSKVRRFLLLLQKENMIRLENVQKTTRITICNYLSYQDKRNDTETILNHERNDTESSMTPTEEYKNLRSKEDLSLFRDLPVEVKTKIDIYPFEDFWNDYDKKIDKPKVEAKWKKLNDAQKLAIKIHIPKYKIVSPDKQYRKNPESYLNAQSWENELISSQLNSLQPKQEPQMWNQ